MRRLLLAGAALALCACTVTARVDPQKPLLCGDNGSCPSGSRCVVGICRSLATNRAPIAADDAAATGEGTAVVVRVLDNDSDPDGDSLNVVAGAAARGTTAVNADRTVTYSPTPGFFGIDPFTYTVEDPLGATASATVTVTVGAATNQPPVANPDNYGVAEGSSLSVPAPGVLGNDTDPEGQPLTARLVTGPSHGTLTLNADGSFAYQPEAGYRGVDTFSYRASDGLADSNVTTVGVSVGQANEPPVAVDDDFAVPAGSPLIVSVPGVLANDTDPEGQRLTARLVSGASGGTVGLNPDGSFVYAPRPGFTGSDAFTYQASDGLADSNVATVRITVSASNLPPTANDDDYAMTAGGTLAIAAPGVLANDSDPEGQTLTATLVAGPAHGTLALGPDGSFTYTPDPAYTGPDSFTYRAGDGGAESGVATVRIAVNPANQAPVANADNYATMLDAPLNVGAPGILANDIDPEGQALTARLVSGPARGTLTLNPDGSFSYAPESGFMGTDAFTYAASDGALESTPATVSIAVGAANAPPTASPDSYAVSGSVPLSIPAPGVLANDSDPEAQPLTARLVAGPAHGTLSLGADGSFTYTAAAGYSGADSFTYQANDGLADSAPAIVTLTVDAAPIAADDVATALGGVATLIDVLANDRDPEGGALVVTGATASEGTVVVEADGRLTYTPLPAFVGPATIDYQIRDGASPPNAASARVVVVKRPALGAAVLHPVGTAPVAVALGDIDRNGRADVAVANSGSDSVSVFFQQANGTLAAAAGSPFSAGSGPSGVAIGQMLGNPVSPLDVAVANRAAGTVTLRSGSDLANTFESHAVGSNPVGVAISNVNQAGREDVVVANAFAAPGNVNVLYAPFSGAPVALSAGGDPTAVAVSDLDGNGLPDVVVANGGSGDVTVLLQGPTGVFAARTYAVGGSPSAVAVGDLNGDARPDIAVASAGAGTVSVILQISAGNFGAAFDVPAGPSPASVALGDVNGDGRVDVVVANAIDATAGNVSVLASATAPGSATVLFAAPVTFSSGGTFPTAVAVGNLDGDTRPDVAVANRGSNDLAVLPNQN